MPEVCSGNIRHGRFYERRCGGQEPSELETVITRLLARRDYGIHGDSILARSAERIRAGVAAGSALVVGNPLIHEAMAVHVHAGRLICSVDVLIDERPDGSIFPTIALASLLRPTATPRL